MTTCLEAMQQAHQRGIQLRIDADGNVKVSDLTTIRSSHG